MSSTTSSPTRGGVILPFGRRLGYGLGDAGMNFSWSFISIFAMFYMTTIVGVGASILGTVMLLARLADGLTDLLFGGLLDRTHTRWGKARPWLFISTFPLAIGTFMLFNVPDGLSNGAKVAWFATLYVLIGAFFYTAANISYNALTALATDDENTRVSMGSIRFICALGAYLLLSSITYPLVRFFGTGQKGWTAVGLIYSVAIIVLLLTTFFTVKEMRTTETAEDKEQDAAEQVSFGESFKIILTSKYFLMVLLLMLLHYIGAGLNGTAGAFYATYVLGDENALGTLTMAALLPSLAVLPFIPAFVDKVGSRMANMIGAVAVAVGYVTACAGKESMVIIIVGLVIQAIGAAPFLGTYMAYVAKVADNILLRTGKKIEGMTFSASSVGIKVGQGLGAAIVGWVLGGAGFDASLPTQPDTALAAIGLLYLGLPAVISIAKAILFYFFKVDEDNARLRDATEKQASIDA